MVDTKECLVCVICEVWKWKLGAGRNQYIEWCQTYKHSFYSIHKNIV